MRSQAKKFFGCRPEPIGRLRIAVCCQKIHRLLNGLVSANAAEIAVLLTVLLAGNQDELEFEHTVIERLGSGSVGKTQSQVEVFGNREVAARSGVQSLEVVANLATERSISWDSSQLELEAASFRGCNLGWDNLGSVLVFAVQTKHSRVIGLEGEVKLTALESLVDGDGTVFTSWENHLVAGSVTVILGVHT